MNQSPARNDETIDFFIAHSMTGKSLYRSERKACMDQTGKVMVRTQRGNAELNPNAAIEHRWFPLGANVGSLSHGGPHLAICHDYRGILLKQQPGRPLLDTVATRKLSIRMGPAAFRSPHSIATIQKSTSSSEF